MRKKVTGRNNGGDVGEHRKQQGRMQIDRKKKGRRKVNHQGNHERNVVLKCDRLQADILIISVGVNKC